MAETGITFQPVRGTEEAILNMPPVDGRVYFAIDTKKIFLDARDKNKLPMGSATSGIYYGNKTFTEADESYTFKLSDIEGDTMPNVDDIVINKPDGAFYRVTQILSEDEFLTDQLAVSGGSGGSALKRGMTIKAEWEVFHNKIINGQAANTIITVKSNTDDYGDPMMTQIPVNWEVRVTGATVPYIRGSFVVTHNEPYTFEIGTKLKDNTNSTILFTAVDTLGAVHTYSLSLMTIDLNISESAGFSKNTLYTDANPVTLECVVKGQIDKKVVFKVDDAVVDEQILDYKQTGKIKSKQLTTLEHGSHVARIELYSYDNEIEDGPGPNVLEFEFAYKRSDRSDPIIWLGSYKPTYFSYDKIQIPYLAYDPMNPTATVTFYKGSTPLESKTTTVSWKDGSANFKLLEITDATVGMQNMYTIMCGITSKNIMFECKEDEDRDMNILANNLLVKFDAAGRSNSESAVNREIWNYTAPVDGAATYKGQFENFNWYNNGWIMDEDSNTCLRISNGAKFTVPLGTMILNTNTDGQASCTFEFEFRVRNIQDYSHVVKTITRYTAKEGSVSDNDAYAAFNAQSVYDNYDTFLTAMYDANHTNIQHYMGEDLTYDDLTISKTDKIKNSSAAFAKYYNTTGFCLGAQDGFFFDGTNTVNVNYVEDKLVNLAIVFDYQSKLIMFYLNGVMTSVAHYISGSKIELDGQNLVFSSNTCDIDLYKFRVYNEALDVREIDRNYAVDKRDIYMYDQSDMLAIPNAAVNNEYQLNFEKMMTYNETHPDDHLMPYLVIDTTDATVRNGGLGAGVLPYRKKDKTRCVHVEFVNTGLEHAYETGEISDLAEAAGYKDDEEGTKNGLTAIEKYYIHHCPSWTSRWPTELDGATTEVAESNPQDISAVSLSVQGTSSEYYPRRNYKIKLKGKRWVQKVDDDDNPVFDSENKPVMEQDDNIFMYMNRGPYTDKYLSDPSATQLEWFYMDNDTVGTTKFTLKVDYMESSGTYNMGFANLVKNAYTKHPLNDYNNANAFCKEKETTYPVATEFVAGTKYYVAEPKDGKVSYVKAAVQPTADTFSEQTYYIEEKHYETYKFPHLEDYRTSVQGFPVLAFHKNGDDYTFIGRYNMLIDKGSDEMYGFKPDKKILQAFAKYKKVRDIAECWEFSDNSRTWCSFNDPKGRTELSFHYEDTSVDGGEKLNEPETGGIGGAPYVANSFEYRYHKHSDLLDYLYDTTMGGVQLIKGAPLDGMDDSQYIKKTDDPNVEDSYSEYAIADYGDLSTQEARNDVAFDLYKNWEKACKWLYSVRINNQPSQNTYVVASDVTAENFGDNDYYIKIGVTEYEEATGDFDPTAAYYEKVVEVKEGINTVSYEYKQNLTQEQYEKDTYYLANTTGYKRATSYNSDETYYLADFSYQDAAYRLTAPVTYGNKTYEYDTQEYRLAKFKNELKDHFDLEYCIVYFIMTEIFMCYDSRGKNSMMASWGPLKAGGEYIWYPIFYDIDTQLGINNTGIPSFEYYINASDEGCFSTNDSVLWTNLYKAFLPEITAKYYNLRGGDGGIVNVNTHQVTTPLMQADNSSLSGVAGAVEHIENWYLAHPETCESIAMRGERPLICLNLDEYYKYLSIANHKIGYQDRNGGIIYDDGYTFLYALQGDRSLSRQQFLSNRITFLDSWLHYGEYARAGSAIFGRIGANKSDLYSDKWVNTKNPALFDQPVQGSRSPLTYSPYYDENGNKTNYLDADIQVALTPYQRSYVTIGGDNGICDAGQYIDHPVELDLPTSVVDGRLNSPDYNEQLFYIYGTRCLQDIGDMSTMYWTEFYAEGCPRLQRILLGTNYPGFKNHNMNYPNFDAQNNKPMLREVNLDGVMLNDQASSKSFNFTSSEKLTRFEALRSNIENVTFAKGVALDTLYLPSGITSFELVEARKLNTVLTSLPMPNNVEEWEAWDRDEHKGLYIDGLTNLLDTDIAPTSKQYSTINKFIVAGGALKYGTYRMLNTLYQLKTTAEAMDHDAHTLSISLTDVDWSPYGLLVEGDRPTSDRTYWLDDRHYHFVPYSYSGNMTEWNKYIADRRLYSLPSDFSWDGYVINDLNLLTNIKEGAFFSNTNSTGDTAIPAVTGLMFVNNTDAVEESNIRNNLLEWYPELQVFFANITKANAANFIVVDDETGAERIVATQRVAIGSAANWFLINPYTNQNYQGLASKNHWVFRGWSLDPEDVKRVALDVPEEPIGIVDTDQWMEMTFDPDRTDWNFYAIFKKETYDVHFIDGNGNECAVIPTTYGEPVLNMKIVPGRDDSALPADQCYNFVGWKLNPNSASIIEITTYPITDETTFYATFKQADVRKTVHPEYFIAQEDSYVESTSAGYNATGVKLTLRDDIVLSGKLTIPTRFNDQPVIGLYNFYEGGNPDNAITQIFVQEDSELRHICESCFGKFNFDMAVTEGMNTLKFFDFETAKKLRSIDICGFAGVRNLTMVSNLSPNLYRIQERGMNGAFGKGVGGFETRLPGQNTIYLPSSLTIMNRGAFGAQEIGGLTIYIGSEQAASQLNLENSINGSSWMNLFYQNDYNDRYSTLVWYTENYFWASEIRSGGQTYANVEKVFMLSGNSATPDITPIIIHSGESYPWSLDYSNA